MTSKIIAAILIIVVIILIVVFYHSISDNKNIIRQGRFIAYSEMKYPPSNFLSLSKVDNIHFEQEENKIWISWNSDDQATSYKIYWSQINNFNYHSQSVGSDITHENHIYLNEDIFDGGLFYFVIVAFNEDRKSSPSNQFQLVPKFPDFFKICSEENDNYCLSGTHLNNHIWNVEPSDCIDGGCVWIYDETTKHIKLANDKNICISQNIDDLNTRICQNDSDEEWDIDFNNNSICNPNTNKCFQSDQSNGNTISTDIGLASDNKSNRFHWLIKSANIPIL